MTQMNEVPIRAVSHIGICVSDMERSSRFYTEALGFAFHHSVAAGEPYGTLVELEPFKYRASFFDRDGVRVELLAIDSPGVVGPKERRAMNQVGLTHLSFIVDDLKGTVDRIVKFGGHALPQTKVSSQHGEIMFCTDPDGTRLELWAKPP
jgi:glyoxylase I family protein